MAQHPAARYRILDSLCLNGIWAAELHFHQEARPTLLVIDGGSHAFHDDLTLDDFRSQQNPASGDFQLVR